MSYFGPRASLHRGAVKSFSHCNGVHNGLQDINSEHNSVDVRLISFLSPVAMPSVRVRRGSQYTTLSGSENGDQNDERGTATGGATRPRSRTIASIYSSFRQSAQAQEADTSGASPSQLRPERPFNSLNRSSKVEDAIKKQASRTLRPSDARRSFSPSGGHSGRASYEYDRDHSDVGSRPRDSVILEGSQADVVVPRDGPMGRVGSALSVTDSHVDSFDDSSTDELNHHEDEIVEHLDVIGMMAMSRPELD